MGILGNLLNAEAMTVATVLGNVQDYVRYFTIAFLVCCGLLVTFFAIYIGFKMATADEEGKRTQAKSQLIYSIVGLVAIVIIALVFGAVIPNLGFSKGTGEMGDAKETMDEIISSVESVVNLTLNIIANVAVLLALYIGWKLMSAEDDSKRANAKKQLLWTVIGLVGIVLINLLSSTVINLLITETNTNDVPSA